ncbi:MAG: PQQ-binding-like beta-propeller repeat protein [Opitutae bacterium]|nr:PQQ-binding-like beta-propeller repeat protein [Opitutae bacterium]
MKLQHPVLLLSVILGLAAGLAYPADKFEFEYTESAIYNGQAQSVIVTARDNGVVIPFTEIYTDGDGNVATPVEVGTYNYAVDFDHPFLKDLNGTLTITPIPGSAIIAAVVGGGSQHHFTLYLKEDGTLWGIGSNNNGQLGLGQGNDTAVILTNYGIPEQIAFDVVDVAANRDHALFVKEDGSLWAMGSNVSGQLTGGEAPEEDYLYTPTMVQPPGSDVVEVETGLSYSLYRKNDGSLWVLGEISWGNRPIDYQDPFYNRVADGDVTDFSAGGDSFAMFVKKDGSLWGFGGNIPLPATIPEGQTTPVRIVDAGVKSVSVGISPASSDYLFIKTDGSLWGYGMVAEWFDSRPYDPDIDLTDKSPFQIIDQGVAGVSMGEGHGLFVKEDGSMWGLLTPFGPEHESDPDLPWVLLPKKILGANVASAVGGFNQGHILYIDNSGSLWGFSKVVGRGDYGAVGAEYLVLLEAENPVKVNTDLDYVFQDSVLYDGNVQSAVVRLQNKGRDQNFYESYLDWTHDSPDFGKEVEPTQPGEYSYEIYIDYDEDFHSWGPEGTEILKTGTLTILPHSLQVEYKDVLLYTGSPLDFIDTVRHNGTEINFVATYTDDQGQEVQPVEIGLYACRVSFPDHPFIKELSLSDLYIDGSSSGSAHTLHFEYLDPLLADGKTHSFLHAARRQSVDFDTQLLQLSEVYKDEAGVEVIPRDSGTYDFKYTFDDLHSPVLSGIFTIGESPKGLEIEITDSVTYNGQTQSYIKKVTYNGQDVPFSETYTDLVGNPVDPVNAGEYFYSITFTGDAPLKDLSSGGDPNKTFTIEEATLVVSASSQSRQYGLSNPTLDYQITGFQGSDNSGVISGSPVFTTTATSGSDVGSYVISVDVSGMSSPNYNFFGSNHILSVTRAPLTIRADSTTRSYGQDDPAFTYTVIGFRNSDTNAVLLGEPFFSTTATSASTSGVYVLNIARGSLSATNYALSFEAGTFSIGKISQSFGGLPAQVTLTLGDVDNYSLPATSSAGLPITYTLAPGSPSDVVTVSANTLSATGVGPAMIVATQGGNDVYHPTADAYIAIVVGENQPAPQILLDNLMVAENTEAGSLIGRFHVGVGDSAVDLDAGLVAHYPFNGNANDETGNGHDGVVNGAALTADRFGNENTAYHFDGVDDYIGTSLQASFPDCTISGWFLADNWHANKGSILVHNGAGGSVGGEHKETSILFSDGELVSARWTDENVKTPIEKSTWYHFVAIFTNSSTTLFLNGESVNSKSADYPDVNSLTGFWKLGAARNPPGGFHEGLLDDVRIYNRALDATEVAELYRLENHDEAGEGIDLNSGLVAHYPFNSNANDETGNGYDGVVHGASLGPDRQGTEASAYYFDGVDDYIDVGNHQLDGAFTIASWVYHDGVNTLPWFEAVYATANIDIGLFAKLLEGSMFSRLHVGGNNDAYIDTDKMTVPSGNWYHLVGLWDGQNASLYIDGTAKAAALTGSMNAPVPSNAYLGKDVWRENNADGHGDHLKGRLDDVRVYNRALSAAEVAALYRLGNSDEDGGESGSPVLVDGTTLEIVGGDLPSPFFVYGNELRLRKSMNFEEKESYDVQIKGTVTYRAEGDGQTHQGIVDETFTIRVEDILEEIVVHSAADESPAAVRLGLSGTIAEGKAFEIIFRVEGSVLVDNWPGLTDLSYETYLLPGEDGGLDLHDHKWGAERPSNGLLVKGSPASETNDFDWGRQGHLSIGVDDPAPEGLVAHYPFNGNANDETGNGHDGIVHGASLGPDRQGTEASAYYFDGVDDYIDVGNHQLGGAFTIASWVYHDGVNTLPWFESVYTTANIDIGIHAHLLEESMFSRLHVGGNNDAYLDTDKMTVPTGNWYHLVGSWDGQSASLYIDGIAMATALTGSMTAPVPSNAYLGKNVWRENKEGLGEHLKGRLDDVRVYNRALSDWEIRQLYEGSQKDVGTHIGGEFLGVLQVGGYQAPAAHDSGTDFFVASIDDESSPDWLRIISAKGAEGRLQKYNMLGIDRFGRNLVFGSLTDFAILEEAGNWIISSTATRQYPFILKLDSSTGESHKLVELRAALGTGISPYSPYDLAHAGIPLPQVEASAATFMDLQLDYLTRSKLTFDLPTSGFQTSDYEWGVGDAELDGRGGIPESITFAGPVHYELVEGEGDEDNPLFTIYGDELRPVGDLDSVRDRYSVRIRATDTFGDVYEKATDFDYSGDRSEKPPVVDPPHAPPVITSNGGGETASISVAENQTAVTTVTVRNANMEETLFYSLPGGADRAVFSINDVTGVLSFIAPPDFEAPADVDANNTYEVQVKVSNGTLSDTQLIAVTVTDIDEFPSGPPSSPPSVDDFILSPNSIEENNNRNAFIGRFFIPWAGSLSKDEMDTGYKKVWSFKTGGQVQSSPAMGPNGWIYIGSNDGNLYALNQKGEKMWERKVGTNIGRNSPAISSNGTVYIGSNNHRLHALDGQTGEDIWPPEKTKSNIFSGGVWSSPSIDADGAVYIGSRNQKLYAFNGATGDFLWDKPLGGNIASTAAIGRDGSLFIGAEYSSNRIFKLDALTGDELKSHRTGHAVSSSPALGVWDVLHVGSSDQHVYALDVDTFDVVWKRYLSKDIYSSPAVGIDGSVYIGTLSPKGKFYSLNGITGEPIWEFQTGGPIYSSPALAANGLVYVGSDDGNLYALYNNEGSGEKLWEFPTEGKVQSSPLLGPDGIVYFGSSDGNVYAVQGNETAGPAASIWPMVGQNTMRTHRVSTEPESINFELVSGEGDSDNASFVIEGNKLRTLIRFDFEVKETYSIRVRANLPDGSIREKSFVVSIENLPDPINLQEDVGIEYAQTMEKDISVYLPEATIHGSPLSYSLRDGTSRDVIDIVGHEIKALETGVAVVEVLDTNGDTGHFIVQVHIPPSPETLVANYDRDGDGFSDSIESIIGTDDSVFTVPEEFATLTIDPDRDGFTSDLEEAMGMSPLTSNEPGVFASILTDPDGDGLANSLESSLGLDLQSKDSMEDVARNILDPDGDGLTNTLEDLYGLDPAVPNSVEDLSSQSGNTPPMDLFQGEILSPFVKGWVWVESMGWLFVDPSTFPYIYRKNWTNDGGGWLWFLPSDDGIIWYYNFSTGNWEQY